MDPEDAIPADFAALLKDWLAVEHAGRTEFYHLLANGGCQKTTQAPRAGHSARILPNDNGYWIVRRNDLFIFWPQLGQLAQFNLAELASGDKDMSGTVDENPAIARSHSE